MLPVIYSTNFSHSTSFILFFFHTQFLINSLTLISSLLTSLSSRKYKALNFIRLSNQKLEFPYFNCHYISCSISSLVFIIFLHTWEAPIFEAIIGWCFLLYLFHIYYAHSEDMEVLKVHQSLAIKKFVHIMKRSKTNATYLPWVT